MSALASSTSQSSPAPATEADANGFVPEALCIGRVNPALHGSRLFAREAIDEFLPSLVAGRVSYDCDLQDPGAETSN